MTLPKDNEILLELHKTVSLRGIAEMYGVSHQSVANRLGIENATKTRLRRSECALKRYEEGVKVEDIAKEFGVSSQRIWCIREHNLSLVLRY
jgi:uncharacterized protein YjcR